MESVLYGIFALAALTRSISDTSPIRVKIPHTHAFHEVISILSRISLIEIHTEMDFQLVKSATNFALNAPLVVSSFRSINFCKLNPWFKKKRYGVTGSRGNREIISISVLV